VPLQIARPAVDKAGQFGKAEKINGRPKGIRILCHQRHHAESAETHAGNKQIIRVNKIQGTHSRGQLHDIADMAASPVTTIERTVMHSEAGTAAHIGRDHDKTTVGEVLDGAAVEGVQMIIRSTVDKKKSRQRCIGRGTVRNKKVHRDLQAVKARHQQRTHLAEMAVVNPRLVGVVQEYRLAAADPIIASRHIRGLGEYNTQICIAVTECGARYGLGR